MMAVRLPVHKKNSLVSQHLLAGPCKSKTARILQSISGAEKFAFQSLHLNNCRSALKIERKGRISSGFSQAQPEARSVRRP